MQGNDTTESVTCPWCETSFAIVPTSSARAFRCPKCDQESSLGALRNPDLRPDALAIAKAASQASAANLYRHTAAYTYVNKRGEEEFASGTLIRISDRLFLATVAHSVPSHEANVTFVKKSSGLITPERIECVSRRVASKHADVAAFELAADTPRKTGLEAITIDRLHDGSTGNPNFKASLIGYPATYKLENFPYTGMKGFHALCYGCEPIEPARWPAISKYPGTFDESVHVVVEFNRDIVDHSEELPVPKGLPDPPGMSGGGMWQRVQRIKDDEIWTADHLRLFAIQSSWLTQKSFLKAIQIIHWLRLVADEYPDLGGELRDRFPRLKEL